MDPLTPQYPELTPYQFASNTPIQAIDLDGLESFYYSLSFDNYGESVLTLEHVHDGKIGNAGFWNFVTYDGKQILHSAGNETVNTGFEFLLGGLMDLPDNSQYGRVSQLEGKSEEYINKLFGANLSYEEYSEEKFQKRGETIDQILQPAFSASPSVKTLTGTKTPAPTSPKTNSAVVPKKSVIAKTAPKPEIYTSQKVVLDGGNNKNFQGSEGVYVHHFKSGKVYVGSGNDLGHRPYNSLQELTNPKYSSYKKSAGVGNDQYTHSQFIKLKDTNASSIGNLEMKILKSFGTHKSKKNYNQRAIPNNPYE